MSSDRPATPPAQLQAGGQQAKSPLTPEQVRRIEINRLKAKALREQREAEAAALQRSDTSHAGQKRPYAAYAQGPSTLWDGRADPAALDRPLEAIQPARNFAKYVEYDFSKMTDTKGGFLTQDDDPHNNALHARDEEASKPANMSMKEWERQQLLRSLRNEWAGPFEPGITGVRDETTKSCRECGILEIDWKWDEVFGMSVCNACKDKFPDKYSLLTKTEAREDYLLTDRKCLGLIDTRPS
jgi:DNA-repair protein complementing XP-A cells